MWSNYSLYGGSKDTRSSSPQPVAPPAQNVSTDVLKQPNVKSDNY